MSRRPGDGGWPPRLEVPHLVVWSGRLRGECRAIANRGLLIGRSGDVDLALDEAPVSRRHARVDLHGDHFELSDLGSKNGCFLRGRLQNASRTLIDGDRIRVGNTELLFFDPGSLPPDLASGTEARHAPPLASEVIYSAGRVEGRGLLFDCSVGDARVLSLEGPLDASVAVRLVLPELTGSETGTLRGEVVQTSPAGFTVRFLERVSLP